MEAYFATANLGAIYVSLNFRDKGDELTYMLNNSEASALFAGERYIDLANSIHSGLTSAPQLVSIESKHDGMRYYEDIISSSSPAEEVVTEIGDDDTTILPYTTGTTGSPKGVMLSHNSFTIYVLETGEFKSGELAPRIQALFQKKEEMEIAKAESEEILRSQAVDLADKRVVLDYVEDLKDLLEKSSIIEQRVFLKSFVDKIEVSDSEVSLYYTIPMPPSAVQDETVGVVPFVHHG